MTQKEFYNKIINNTPQWADMIYGYENVKDYDIAEKLGHFRLYEEINGSHGSGYHHQYIPVDRGKDFSQRQDL